MSLVPFNNMPANIKVPLAYFEFNAGTPAYSGRSSQLIIGHKTNAGTVALNTLTPLGNIDPNILFGAGSMLADMCNYARQQDPLGSINVLAVPEPTGVPLIATLTLTGTALNSGTLTRFIVGEPVSIQVVSGDTPSTLAARFVAVMNQGYIKFNRRMAFPVIATQAGGVITLASVHAGSSSNQIRFDVGLDGNQIDPAGITLAYTITQAGSGDIDMGNALVALGTANAEWITSPCASITGLNIVRDFLSFAGTGRWSPTVQKQGHYTTVMSGNLAVQTAFGATRNDPHTSILAVNDVPQPLWCWAASLNGAIAASKNLGAPLSEALEIARPLQTIVLQGLRPPAHTLNNWAMADRQALYSNGMAGFTVRDDGQVAIDRMVTTYQTSAFGAIDNTFMDIESLAVSAYAGRYIKAQVELTYPRCVLRSTNPLNLPNVVTPASARATSIHAYTELCSAGICENPELFAQYCITEQSTDPSRLNQYLPMNIARQLRVFAGNITIFQAADAARLSAFAA